MLGYVVHHWYKIESKSKKNRKKILIEIPQLNWRLQSNQKNAVKEKLWMITFNVSFMSDSWNWLSHYETSGQKQKCENLKFVLHVLAMPCRCTVDKITADVGSERHLTVVDHGLPSMSSESTAIAAAVHLWAAKPALAEGLRNKSTERSLLKSFKSMIIFH